jgi:hypothetical protein
MNSKLLGCACLMLVSLSLKITSPAQDTQRFEAFAGYSFSSHTSFPINYNSYNFNGWNGSSTVFVNRWLGLTADFSGSYGSQNVAIFCYPGGCVYNRASVSSYTYLAGPHLVYRHHRYAPFTEMLVGVHNPHLSESQLGSCGPALCSAGSTSSFHKFAMAVGGGLDIALPHGISIRPVDVDYLLLREPAFSIENDNLIYHGTNNNTFRFSAGFNFRFGSHLGSSK